MLRHYDAIGLLAPAEVDSRSGYRFYEADQLQRLNRLIALKELGFTLEQVQAILDEEVGIDELHGMLRMRRAQLAAQIAADGGRLARVEARLRVIESEGQMNTDDVLLKRVTPVRVAELSGVADGYGPEHIGPVIQPLYEELGERAEALGIEPSGPPIAYYEATGDDGGSVLVHAGIPVVGNGKRDERLEFAELPEIESAATLLHRGAMDDVEQTLQALAHWIEENGYRSLGFHREVYLECPAAREQWLTELQVAVVAD